MDGMGWYYHRCYTIYIVYDLTDIPENETISLLQGRKGITVRCWEATVFGREKHRPAIR